MAGLRCFNHYKGQKLPNQIILSETESNHLIKVRRAQINDIVSIFDGKGNEWECRLYLANSKKAVLKVKSHHIEYLMDAYVHNSFLQFCDGDELLKVPSLGLGGGIYDLIFLI